MSSTNELSGRAVGDDLIRQALIHETVHPDAFLARSGPSALCSGLVRRFRRVIHHLGELMLSVFGKTIRAGEDEHGVAAAIGVAIYPLDAEGGVEFERRAGIARYCETAGKSAVCYYEAHTGTIRRTARPERAGLRRRTAFRRRKCAMD